MLGAQRYGLSRTPQPQWRGARASLLLAAALLGALPAGRVAAHPADEVAVYHYLWFESGAAALTLQHGSIIGGKITERVWSEMDADGSGSLSDAEKKRFADQLASRLSLTLGDRPAAMKLESWDFPTRAELTGGGFPAVVLKLSVRLPELPTAGLPVRLHDSAWPRDIGMFPPPEVRAESAVAADLKVAPNGRSVNFALFPSGSPPPESRRVRRSTGSNASDAGETVMNIPAGMSAPPPAAAPPTPPEGAPAPGALGAAGAFAWLAALGLGIAAGFHTAARKGAELARASRPQSRIWAALKLLLRRSGGALLVGLVALPVAARLTGSAGWGFSAAVSICAVLVGLVAFHESLSPLLESAAPDPAAEAPIAPSGPREHRRHPPRDYPLDGDEINFHATADLPGPAGRSLPGFALDAVGAALAALYPRDLGLGAGSLVPYLLAALCVLAIPTAGRFSKRRLAPAQWIPALTAVLLFFWGISAAGQALTFGGWIRPG